MPQIVESKLSCYYKIISKAKTIGFAGPTGSVEDQSEAVRSGVVDEPLSSIAAPELQRVEIESGENVPTSPLQSYDSK